ncbi:Signal transduction histidine kinase [Prevotella aff. ruminicola Tc2-24]|uniref:histidine kinase n=1 Tax=Prevotella aff. ruminicola Tc2-24 TaxID=81582 RepID=A0A1I0PKP2_9BACT|nr:ATP-binding protein [Prevotella aff. ruminicola Tc2-24]SEW14377.1 Signal transduction histidine kinase [Prevotella aff. ruminicola Tc2-24]
MTRKPFIRYITVLVLLLGCTHIAHAQLKKAYDAETPLVIACNWDMAPYEFNNEGEPDGYNIQLLGTILDKLQIQYKVLMTEGEEAMAAFERHEADIIIDPGYRYHGRPYVLSHSIIDYYRVKVATYKKVQPLVALSHLTKKDTVILKENDYASNQIVTGNLLESPYKYLSPKTALADISKGEHKYFIWSEAQLKWTIRKLTLDNIVLSDVDIPDGEFHIVGYDKELINAIDDEYARLEQLGELEKIHDQWFHPERVHNDTSPLALIILTGIIIVTVIALLLSRLIHARVRAAVRQSVEINQMMEQALNMGNFYIIEYDLHTRHAKNIYGDHLPEEGMDIEELIKHFHPDDRKGSGHDAMVKKAERSRQWAVSRRWNAGTEAAPIWRYLRGNTVVEYEDGKPRYIVYSIKDISKEIEEERVNSETASKYLKMFGTNLVAMSIYDKNGILLDTNENMKRLCDFDEQIEAYFHQVCLFDVPLLKGQFDPKSHENFHVCQKMHYPEYGIDKYIEFKVRPTFDNNDELRFYVVTARDLSEERIMYLEQRRHDANIQKANETISHYEKQLNYLLENSQMFIWHFDPEKNVINFTRTTHKTEYHETLEEFFKGVDEKDRETLLNGIKECVATKKPYNAIHRYKYTPLEEETVWYSISGVPTFDKDGTLIKYFGIARNITNLMVTQQKLIEETKRAEDSGKMKSAFLANMTHEIRTPLNAIVGFSDLLPVVDSSEERMEFIRIIRNNCEMLMRLINDILEASNMGQSLAIKPTKVDFATAFDDICQTLAQRVQGPHVKFIKDNPYTTYPATLDIGRIQQVLTNFVTNAVKYTREGYIKVGYHEEDGGIYYYCEDTGAGIPKEKQDSVFERFVKLNDFVQGTGLGLSICKAIAEHCGGKIGVTSEGSGQGSRFWLWTPRDITS